jgi:hypothetical protein
MPSIAVGKVGTLSLQLPIREIYRLCKGQIHDTVAHGDESIDTAFVISRPGLLVLGRMGNIGNDEGYHAFTMDSNRVVYYWTVSGTRGLLPGGVTLSSSLDSLTSAYGRRSTDALNGDVYVRFCRLPQMVFHFDAPPRYDTLTKEQSDAALGLSRVATIDLPSKAKPETPYFNPSVLGPEYSPCVRV